MHVKMKRILIGTAAAATLVLGVGVAGASAGSDSGRDGREIRNATAVQQAERRGREAELRGRIAEGEREAEARGRVAEGEQEPGDDHGANQGADNRGRGGAEDGRHGHHGGANDRSGSNRGDG